jgi:hypothetical protein
MRRAFLFVFLAACGETAVSGFVALDAGLDAPATQADSEVAAEETGLDAAEEHRADAVVDAGVEAGPLAVGDRCDRDSGEPWQGCPAFDDGGIQARCYVPPTGSTMRDRCTFSCGTSVIHQEKLSLCRSIGGDCAFPCGNCQPICVK